ncbi:MAG: GAP family protein [Candidatus Diapherotrites archaeon]|nr:GAP family protein [Candidatus Diapherotrites archaeon]
MNKNFLMIFFVLIFFSFSVFSSEQALFKGKPVELLFYYSSGCPHCANLNEHLIKLEGIYAEKINIIRKNASDDFQEFISVQEKFGVPLNNQSSVPKVFIGDFYCIGDTPCIECLEPRILFELKQLQETDLNECNENDLNSESNDLNSVVSENTGSEVNLFQLIGLALVDAVNPCELAVLVILMAAILSRYPNQRKKALKAGIAFSSAIFLMYFIFGILIIVGFKTLLGVTQLNGTWFYYLLGGIALLLGLLNLKDAVWYGGGGFVMEVPQSWRPRMKAIIEGTTSTAGAFITGLIVSFFLTPCTSGPYFVAGGILSGLDLISAIPLLLIYLCFFISPMIAILAITYLGFMAIDDVSSWREKNIKKLHWIAGLLLLGLGLAMIFGLI